MSETMFAVQPIEREALKQLILDALLCSSHSAGGNALDHIADALYSAGVVVSSVEEKRKAPVKRKYGTYQNVRLTDEENERLHSDYPGKAKEAIDCLSEYMKMTGKSYKDHNLALRKWVFDALDEVGYKGVYNFELVQKMGVMTDEFLAFTGKYLREFIERRGNMK